MKDTTFIGMEFQDDDGTFAVVGFEDGLCEVVYTQDGQNQDKHYMMDPDEVMIRYYGWDQITDFMDEDLREEVHIDMAPCPPLDFLKEYSRRHLDKFGEEFTVE